MPTGTLCPTTCPGPPTDPLGSTFSLNLYRLDTTITCFHLLFFLDLFFATLSTKSFMALSGSLFRIFDQGHSGGRPSRPSQSIDFFWTKRVPVQSYFSLPSILKNGSPVPSSGTSGRSYVSASKYFCLTVPLIPRFQDLGKLPGDVPHVRTLMTLMSTFVRLVVRGHGEKICCAYLAFLSPARDISSSTSEEMVKFLISKDKSGKTVLHRRSCSEVPCEYPDPTHTTITKLRRSYIQEIINNYY